MNFICALLFLNKKHWTEGCAAASERRAKAQPSTPKRAPGAHSITRTRAAGLCDSRTGGTPWNEAYRMHGRTVSKTTTDTCTPQSVGGLGFLLSLWLCGLARPRGRHKQPNHTNASRRTNKGVGATQRLRPKRTARVCVCRRRRRRW